MKIAIVGATGFVGQAAIEHFLASTNFEIVAIARTVEPKIIGRTEWRAADLFSLKQTEEALRGCDYALYLLHSMSPSNRLTQGKFEDFDFILADNFARAAETEKLKHLIYVGGMIDEKSTKNSKHLMSRLEVENTLRAYKTPVTALRCSLVIGARGSSFIILKKLVHRLPFMLLPAWVKTICQPIFIGDLAEIILRVVGDETAWQRIYDVGGPERLSYRDLIQRTARASGIQTVLIDVPAVPLRFSKLWVRVVTGTPRSLVYPLIDSLTTQMTVASERQLDEKFVPSYLPLEEALKRSVNVKSIKKRVISDRPDKVVAERSEVRSVQRFRIPEVMTAEQVGASYFHWLPGFFNRLIYVQRNVDILVFKLLGLKKPLLLLKYAQHRSLHNRQLFYITGGILAKPSKNGRLEFRESPDGEFIFAAIHDFKPSLPWWLYRCSQAIVHEHVMRQFAKYLNRTV